MEETALHTLLESLAKNPIFALFALVFLVQAYMMVNHLDTVNETLKSIHEDNIIIREYIIAEGESTKEYVDEVQALQDNIKDLETAIKGK